MKHINAIEKLFGINITRTRSAYVYDKPISVEQAQAVVDANADVAWQDPKNPDCGNNDGVLYLAISVDDEGIECEPVLFAFDNSDMSFYIV